MTPSQRRAARFAARTGTAISGTMFALCSWAAITGTSHPVGAAPSVEVAQVVKPRANPAETATPLTTGTKNTLFTLQLPQGAGCTGDSAHGNYRVQSYMVPASVEPTTLKFDAFGPTPQGSGASFRQPLFASPGQDPYVQVQTAQADSDGGLGRIINIPSFDLTVLGPTLTANAGTYNIGIACTLGPETSATQLDKLWNVQLVLAADATWTVSATQASSSTSSSTTSTTVSGGSSNSTSSTSSTSTTSTVGSTSSTIVGDPTSTTVGGAADPDPGVPSSGVSGSLALTGGDPTRIMVWGALFLVFGRMAILLGRRTEVV